MHTVTEIEAVGTLSFHAALMQAETQARSTLDVALHERLSCAVALVKAGAVFQANDHTWTVASASTPGKEYSPNGTCSCADMYYNKPRWCKHQLAMFLSQRVLTLMQQPPAPVVPEMVEPWPANDGDAPTSTNAPLPPAAADGQAPQGALPEAPPVGLDPRHLTYLHGKPFVRFAGLLALAHERGLVSLKARFISVTADLALAEAEAIFASGLTVCEGADSTPQSVPAHIKPHFPRMALTRAKARALRDALNVSLVALEELEGGA